MGSAAEKYTPEPSLLIEHLHRKLAEVNVVESPFPHLVLDEFLPEAFFQRLLESYPNSQRYPDAKDMCISKKSLLFEDEHFMRHVETEREWNEFYRFLSGKEYLNAFLAKFAPYFEKFGATLSPDDVIGTKFDVAWAGAGYTRACHLDRRHHAAASLLYFNSSDDFGGSGGSLYLYDTNLKPPYDKFPAPEDVSVAVEVQPAPNRFVAFLNTSAGYHGIEPMRESHGLRKFIYISVDNRSRDNMWPNVVVASEERRQAFLKS